MGAREEKFFIFTWIWELRNTVVSSLYSQPADRTQKEQRQTEVPSLYIFLVHVAYLIGSQSCHSLFQSECCCTGVEKYLNQMQVLSLYLNIYFTIDSLYTELHYSGSGSINSQQNPDFLCRRPVRLAFSSPLSIQSAAELSARSLEDYAAERGFGRQPVIHFLPVPCCCHGNNVQSPRNVRPAFL